MPAGAPRNIAATIGLSLAFVALLFACAIGANWLVAPPLIWLARHLTPDHPIPLSDYLELAAALGATAIMVRSIDKRPWSDIGLGRSAAKAPLMVRGFFVGGAAMGFTCVLLLAVGLLRFEDGAGSASWGGAALRVTLVLLPAALAEEMVFRGYLLTVIRDSIGARGAVLLTSVLFGSLHVWNPGWTVESVIDVTLAGVLLATVRIASNSLFAAWMAHFAWNWVMAVPFHATVSGLKFESPGYQAVTVEPSWLSGGSWGPEGGLAAALGLLGGLGYLYARHRREES